jgi:hypothetical protein
MEFEMTLERFAELFMQYWELALAIFGGLSICFTYVLRRWRWKSRWFDRIINVSVNFVDRGLSGSEDPTLRFRSLRDDDTNTVLLSDYAADLVAKAAKYTTIKNPFIKDLDKEDLGIILRAVQGAISEMFPEGIMRKAVRLQVKEVKFIFGITVEKYGDLTTRKPRVIIMEEEALLELPEREELKFEMPYHQDRWDTLNRMKEAWLKKEEYVMECRIYLPVH